MVMAPLVESSYVLEEEEISQTIKYLATKDVMLDNDLCQNLGRYLTLLNNDIPDFMINFSKAAFIVSNSAKVFGAKVDSLNDRTLSVCDALKYSNVDENKGANIELNDHGNSEKISHRKRKKVRGISSDEDFIEIDNSLSLKKNPLSESDKESQFRLDCRKKGSNMFLRTKKERKKADVCLVAFDDKDESRLREWFLDENMMLVRELFWERSISDATRFCQWDASSDSATDDNYSNYDNAIEPLTNTVANTEQLQQDNIIENVEQLAADNAFNELLASGVVDDVIAEDANNNNNDNFGDHNNQEPRSLATSVADLTEKRVGKKQQCLLNVLNADEPRSELIPSKKIKKGVHVKPPCQLCNKQEHKRRTKNCPRPEGENLDSYIIQLVQPIVTESNFGIMPEDELLDHYKIAVKKSQLFAKQYRKVDMKDILKTYRNFRGFEDDNFEDDILRDNAEVEENGDNIPDGNPINSEDVLPLPNIEPTLPNPVQLPSTDNNDDCMSDSCLSSRNTRLVMEEIKESASAQLCFERNQELRVRIAAWHESLADRIAMSQERGALNMNVLANQIMDRFPAPFTPNGETASQPEIAFADLVSGGDRSNVSRLFLACLQLTNEGNINIEKTSDGFLAKDCIKLKKLRAVRVREEFDHYTTSSNDVPVHDGAKVGKKRRNEPSISSKDDPPARYKKVKK